MYSAWRLLNNLSLFIIRPVSRDEILHSGHAIPTSMYQPSVCLDATQNRPEELAISNTRVELADGRTHLQPSLSDFNRGLHSLTATTGHAKGGSDCLYLSVRTFSPDCLVTTGGDSVISRLLDMCEYLIIEDSDLKEADLVDHLELFSLQSVEAQNMTKPMRLVGNHAYALWSTIKVKSAPAFSGERIW